MWVLKDVLFLFSPSDMADTHQFILDHFTGINFSHTSDRDDIVLAMMHINEWVSSSDAHISNIVKEKMATANPQFIMQRACVYNCKFGVNTKSISGCYQLPSGSVKTPLPASAPFVTDEWKAYAAREVGKATKQWYRALFLQWEKWTVVLSTWGIKALLFIFLHKYRILLQQWHILCSVQLHM